MHQLVRLTFVKWAALTGIVCCTCALAGCDSDSKAQTKETAEKPKAESKQTKQKSNEAKPAKASDSGTQPPAKTTKPSKPARDNPAREPDGPKLADLVNQVGAGGQKVDFEKAAIPVPPPAVIDETKVAAAGIRKVSGKILTLYTDLPADPEIDELPLVFEKALPQWCAYFGLDQAKAANWKPRASLMKDKERFLSCGLLPPDLPPFLHGFQRDSDLWLYEQTESFYRRHLLLHEGTHGFMNVLLGGAGPPWYMEGTAEMLGTHRWKDGVLTIPYSPRAKEESPGWGRVRAIKDETAANRGMMLGDIFDYDSRAHLKPEPYAWCWGACTFLDRHPLTQKAFREMQRAVKDTSPTFSAMFYNKIKDHWPEIIEQWQLFVLECEYGYDVERAAITYRPGQPLGAGNDSAKIAADRGWQSSGIRLEAGTVYQIAAEGRYQIGTQPKTWLCEPGGVTIHYYRGRPLGMLLAAVRADEGHSKQMTPLAKPEPIGLAASFTPPISGTLYLKINESAADLGDNQGTLTVRVRQK